MVALGENPEPSTPVPSTYPNPVANNVNFHPMGWAYGDEGEPFDQNEPIPPGVGNG